jgi:zinc ribbon protein
MFLLFGWGHQSVKEHGPTYKIECPNCDKSEMWQLLQIRTFFTLFFIPVFPYESKKIMICPVCQHALELPDPVFQKAKVVADIHMNLANKKITEFEYKTQMDNFYEDGFNELSNYMTQSAKADSEGVHCPYCNQIVHTDSGGLFIDKCCTKCSKELPMHVINQVKGMFPAKYQ